MTRSLTLISALLLSSLPTLALAVGLGNVETRSALNQPLEARIPVLSASRDDLESLQVRLASGEAFQRVGLDRPFILSRLAFDVEVHDGQPYIVVSTEEPVREPFLAFLVEARWPGGRVMREYTLLLDPPVHAPTGDAPAPGTVADAPAARQPTPEAATAAPARAPVRQEAAPTGSREYGPVRRNQTAWDVALETRPDESVTVQQMMMALLRANPGAFGDGNVNNLHAGAVLRVPDRAEIASMSAAEARREFARQVEQWEAGRTPAAPEEVAEEVAEPAPEDAVAVDDPALVDEDGRLQVVAPADAGGEDAAASLADDELQASPEALAQLQQELTLTREEAAGLRAENEELRQMAAEMRQRVEALERMLDLNLDPGVAGAGDTATEPAVVPESEPEAVAADDAPAVAEAEAREAEPAAAPAPAAARPAFDEQVAPAQPAPWEDPRLLGLAAAVLLVLLALFMLIRRRRQAAADQAELEEDDLAPAAAQPAVAASGAAAAATGVAAVAGAEDAEDDPLVQAESYMGYGRYDDARDTLEAALASESDNKELRLKLLEVHALREDRPAFEAEAQTLYGQVDGTADPVWQQARDMGAQVAPENPLFGEDDARLDQAFDLDDPVPEKSTFAAASDQSSGTTPDALPETLEFAAPAGDPPVDFDEPGEGGRPPAGEDDLSDLESALAEPAEAEDDFSDLEFALSDEPGETPDADTPRADEGQDLSLDFDLDADIPSEKPVGEEKTGDAPAGDTDEEFDLDFDLDEAPSDEPRQAEQGSDGLDFGGASATADTADAGSSGAEDEGDGLFEDADENSTKLDLARAYLEMGDGEGARSLLEEVLQEGSNVQKQEAEELLEQT
ncbi:MAG: hypothetical protein JJT90_02880 [Ectothiorhodospiraceae bacterium]|nr:hypothetical protein [Ectothiorhodospiraceae bacterium]